MCADFNNRRNRGNVPVPAGYDVQFGYGTQPASKAQVYDDVAGNRLNHTFVEINGLFEGNGENLISTNRTGIASGLTLAQSIDSLVISITNDRGMVGSVTDYVESNTKNIVTMEYPSEPWASGSTTVILSHTTPAKVGTEALKVEAATATAGYFTGRLDLSKSGGLDLTTFNDGSESTDQDYIMLPFYVNSTATIGSAAGQGIIIYLSPSTGMTSYFSHVTTSGLASNGWNLLSVKKADFTSVSGTVAPTWSAITRAQCSWYGTTGCSGNYVIFDDIYMHRKDPTTDMPNPFQSKVDGEWSRDFDITTGFWFLGYSEPGIAQWKNLNPTDTGTGTTGASLVGTVPYTDFIASMTIKAGQNSYTNRLSWQAANDKRVNVYVNNNVMTFTIRWGDIAATYTTPFTVKLSDTVKLMIIRKGRSFKGLAISNGDMQTMAQLSFDCNNLTGGYSIAINESGYLSVSDISGMYYGILDIGITTTELVSEAINAHAVGGIPAYQIPSRISTEYVLYVNPNSGSDYYDGKTSGAAFKSLSRLKFEPPFIGGNYLAANCTIYLASGTYDEGLLVSGINGAGSLTVCGAGANSTFITGVSLQTIGAYVDVTSINFTSNGTCIYIDGCLKVDIENCIATGTAAAGGKYGAQVFYSKAGFFSYNVNSGNAGIKADRDSHVFAKSCQGSGNTYGIYAFGAAVVGRNGTFISGTVDNFATAGAQINT